MQKVQADVVFDANPEAKTEASVPANGAVPHLVQDRYEDDEGGIFGGTHPRPRRDPSTPRPPARDCPPAELNAFPEKEATDNVVGTPAQGLYRWRRTGTQELTALPGFPIDVDSFERRMLRNVTTGANGEFTYETVQPELGTNDIVVTTYKVKPNAVAGPVAPGDTRAGEPDRGIAIARIERLDRTTGNTLSVFEPQPAVLIVPLPVVPGEPISSIGIDPTTGQVLQVQGRVTTRVQVDVCGEMVAGWAAETTQVYSLSGSAQRTYNFVVAPQLGGLLVREHVEQQTTDANSKITFTMGQVEPDALPAGS